MSLSIVVTKVEGGGGINRVNYVLCFILVVPYVLSIPLSEARPESVLRQPSSLLVRPIKRKRTNMTSS